MQAVVPLVHDLKTAGCQIIHLLGHISYLERVPVGAIMGQGEMEEREEFHATLSVLFLPSFVLVFVVVQSRLLLLWVVLEDKEVGFPIPGGGAVGVFA